MAQLLARSPTLPSVVTIALVFPEFTFRFNFLKLICLVTLASFYSLAMRGNGSEQTAFYKVFASKKLNSHPRSLLVCLLSGS